MKFIIKAEAEC